MRMDMFFPIFNNIIFAEAEIIILNTPTAFKLLKNKVKLMYIDYGYGRQICGSTYTNRKRNRCKTVAAGADDRTKFEIKL